MELFSDSGFFISFFVAAIPALLMGYMGIGLKYYGILLSLIYVPLAMWKNYMAICLMAGYIVYEILIAKIYIRLREKRGRVVWHYRGFLIASMAPLVASKLISFFHLGSFGFLGISYLTFKGLQIIIEIYDGVIKEIGFVDTAYFLGFFPSVTSGPIDRSRRFNEDLKCGLLNKKENEEEERQRKRDYMELAGTGLFKMVLGAFYKIVLAACCYNVMGLLGNKHIISSQLIYMYSYGFYLFFDFAGYSLMAVGASYILGIRTPDNFKMPFISVDIKEFWDRWHISLSHWFRDFLFSRLMMSAIKNRWFKDRIISAAVVFIINMTVMGIWHGLDWYYILYGVYHGVFLAINEIYQRKSKFYKKNKKKKWYKIASWFVTFNLVMFGFYIFSGHLTAGFKTIMRYI